MDRRKKVEYKDRMLLWYLFFFFFLSLERYVDLAGFVERGGWECWVQECGVRRTSLDELTAIVKE